MLTTEFLSQHNSISPTNLLMNKQLKSKLDLVLPNLFKHARDVQDKQKQQHNQHAKCQSFNPGDKILARNYNDSEVWLPAQIVEVTSPFSYKVCTDTDDRIIISKAPKSVEERLFVTEQSSQAELSTLDDCIFLSTVANENSDSSTSNNAPVRKSTLIRKPPNRLTL